MSANDQHRACASSATVLSVDKLRTRLCALRPGVAPNAFDGTAALPLRVVPTDDGAYEVVDGFKRLKAWQDQGYQEVPVVVEMPCSIEEQKRMLLQANAPARTLSAMDEALVVCSLIDDEGKTEPAIRRLLGKKSSWVSRRVSIGRHLSASAQHRLANGVIGPSVAHALCALSSKEQDSIIETIERHALRAHESLDLISAFRVADGRERKTLLQDPHGRKKENPPCFLGAGRAARTAVGKHPRGSEALDHVHHPAAARAGRIASD